MRWGQHRLMEKKKSTSKEMNQERSAVNFIFKKLTKEEGKENEEAEGEEATGE